MSNINYATNVPDPIWDNNGFTIPEEDIVLNGVIQDFQNAFDSKLNFYDRNGKFLLSTPQGQLVTSIAAIISDRNKLLANYVNQVDPNYAYGRMQDGIGRIYFIERRPATNTKVIGVCTGGTSTNIPKGTKVQDSNGKIYIADDNYTIGDNGFVNVVFECTETGNIVCPANSLSMYQLIPGWDSVNNPEAGEVGRALESQQQFEQRRRLSVAGNSVNSVDSIQAALFNLVDNNQNPICNDVYVTENPTGEQKTNGNVTLKPNSIYVCVDALDSEKNRESIAKTIWEKKPAGCAMNGDIKVTILDNSVDNNGSPLYSNPPSYDIYFFYAKPVSIYFKITMNSSPNQPNNSEDKIRKAVYDSFNGNDESIRPRIGSTILASDFYSSIYKLGSWVKVFNIEISRGTGYSNTVSIGIDEIPVLIETNIEIDYNGR